MLSNCTSSNACPMVDINSRQYTVLNSSNRAAAQILAGTSFNSEWQAEAVWQTSHQVLAGWRFAGQGTAVGLS